MKKHKNIFIDGFRDPSPIQPLNDIILADIRSDGDHKLILFDTLLDSLIVYKGVNREFQKHVQIKNISGLIHYYDQQSRNPQPNIALIAENGFYIYRGLKQSFRLRIPNHEPQPQQQLLWSQYQQQPQKLTTQLLKLSSSVRLTQTAKYFIGSNTIQRKKQLITKAFSEGVVQKDSICATSVIKSSDDVSPGNVIICTQLKKLYVLDNYGHTILSNMNIDVTAHQVFGWGDYLNQYKIIIVGREFKVSVYSKMNKKSIEISQRILNSVFDYPNLYLLTTGQTLLAYDIQNDIKKKFSLKFSTQPIQIQFLKTRNLKALIVGFQNQIKIYNLDRQLICILHLKQKLLRIKFGTFGRQEGCLIIIYDSKGFQVKIIHRQFDSKLVISRSQNQQISSDTNIPVPKKTNIFVNQANIEVNYGPLIYKTYQKDLKLLKWKVLKQQVKNYDKTDSKIKLNANILGLGPNFILRLQFQNLTQQTLYNVLVLLNYNASIYRIFSYNTTILMLTPHFVYPIDIQFTNISQKGQSDNIKVCIKNQDIDLLVTNVQIPACEILV